MAEASHEKTPQWPSILLLAAVYLSATGWNLHLQPIENPDEPRYACAARHMVRGESGWLVPVFNGEPRLVKPILIYWLMAGSAKLTMPLGIEMATAFRLPSLLFGLLSVLSAFGLGRRLWNARVGLFAGLVLTTTYYFHETSREIVIDPILTGLLTFAWYGFAGAIQSLQREPSRTPYAFLFGFYLALGLACLAKGPAPVAVFVVIPAAAFLIWHRKALLTDLRWPMRTGLAWGAPLALMVGFSWFIWLLNGPYREDIKAFFSEQTFQRGVGQLDHNEGTKAYPFLFYLKDIPSKFLPWALLALPSLAMFFGKKCESAGKDEALPRLSPQACLLLCATAIPFVLLGLAGSKRSLYALPLYPLLAVWAGLLLDRAGHSEKTGKAIAWVPGGLALLAPVTLTIATHILVRLGALPDWPAGVPVVIVLLAWGSVKAASVLRRGPFATGVVQAILVLAVLVLAFEAWLRPAVKPRDEKRAFYAQVAQFAGDRPVAWFVTSANEAVWYLDRNIVRIKTWPGLKEKFFERPGGVLVLRGREFGAKPAFADAVRILAKLNEGPDTMLIVEADPQRPPDPSLFDGPPEGEGDNE